MTEPPSTTGVGAADLAPVTLDGVCVVLADEQSEVTVDAREWGRLAAAVLAAEGRAGELTLTFVDPHEMATLNREHMGQTGATDVLSFPLDAADHAPLDPADIAAEWGPLLLGDVVVCPAVAAANAPTHAGTLDDELALLVVHGVLHVLGHDHAEPAETERMRAAELTHLVAHHWHGPAPSGFRQEQDRS